MKLKELKRTARRMGRRKMDNWINIQDKEPPKDTPILFQEMFEDTYHVGFWSEDENCMLEFKDGSDGYKWTVSKWRHIE